MPNIERAIVLRLTDFELSLLEGAIEDAILARTTYPEMDEVQRAEASTLGSILQALPKTEEDSA